MINSQYAGSTHTPQCRVASDGTYHYYQSISVGWPRLQDFVGRRATPALLRKVYHIRQQVRGLRLLREILE